MGTAPTPTLKPVQTKKPGTTPDVESVNMAKVFAFKSKSCHTCDGGHPWP